MLHPDVLPQLTFQLFSNVDYQFLQKDKNPSIVDVLGAKDQGEEEQNEDKKFVLKYNVQNVEAVNQEVELDKFII